MSGAAPFLSVIVPTRGDTWLLLPLIQALSLQRVARDTYEVLIVFDGSQPDEQITLRARETGTRLLALPERRGPGAARNHGAAHSRGEYLAFTEDDVTPWPDWLERATGVLRGDPSIDVLEGLTMKPFGRPVHRQAGAHPLYLPTNLFVRRSLYERLGGYDEVFCDPARGIYFREDSDFGFRLEKAGARVERDESMVVPHPDEHPHALDPLRWARRHEMDPRLEARHPELFRERIEVHRVGPFTVRRPIVRASAGYVTALVAAVAAWAFGSPDAAIALVLAALAALGVVWSKWRFHPARLPVVALVPFVLIAALLRGRSRITQASRQPGARPRETDPASPRPSADS